MPTKLVELLSKEWETLRKAPVTFVLLFIIALGLAFAIVDWGYSRQLETLKTQIEAKDEQIKEYHDRLELLPEKVDAYSRLTDDELKSMAMELAAEMRNLISRSKNVTVTVMDSSVPPERAEALVRISVAHQAEYYSQYRIKAIILRNEMLSRLPKEAQNTAVDWKYIFPLSLHEFEIVVRDFERITDLMP